jgi:hypothetical protein
MAACTAPRSCVVGLGFGTHCRDDELAATDTTIEVTVRRVPKMPC